MSLSRTTSRALGLGRRTLREATLAGSRAFSALPEADTNKGAGVAEITTSQDWMDLKKQSLAANKGIILQFTAQWCPPCRVISPVVASLAEQYASSVNFVKADIDNAAIGDIVAEHAVSAVPMFVGYNKDGSKSVTFTGADKQALQRATDAVSH